MKKTRTSHLYDKAHSIEFYQKRYAHRYMDDWSILEKKKVLEVLESLGLPDTGKALDYGCGTGVFTAFFKAAYPRWNVFGTDISTRAIEQAKERYPECSFFSMDQKGDHQKNIDFIFTHHALEHVYNLNAALDEMIDFLRDESMMLHILPCGNEGSFEHALCSLRKDGIDPELENRFFLDDVGHVRRLTTSQLQNGLSSRGFLLAKEFYGNQFFGALEWITRTKWSRIRQIADVSTAINDKAKKKILHLRLKIIFLWMLRLPSSVFEYLIRKRKKNIIDYILLGGSIPFVLLSIPLDLFLKRKAYLEWKRRSADQRGSEMFLFFKSRVNKKIT